MRSKLQSDHRQQNNITQFLQAGYLPILLPNQQHRSTEDYNFEIR